MDLGLNDSNVPEQLVKNRLTCQWEEGMTGNGF
jgi:hypothetical protein